MNYVYLIRYRRLVNGVFSHHATVERNLLGCLATLRTLKNSNVHSWDLLVYAPFGVCSMKPLLQKSVEVIKFLKSKLNAS